jgi:hypothetical protein
MVTTTVETFSLKTSPLDFCPKKHLANAFAAEASVFAFHIHLAASLLVGATNMALSCRTVGKSVHHGVASSQCVRRRRQSSGRAPSQKLLKTFVSSMKNFESPVETRCPVSVQFDIKLIINRPKSS